MQHSARFISKFVLLFAFGIISWPLAAENTGSVTSDTVIISPGNAPSVTGNTPVSAQSDDHSEKSFLNRSVLAGQEKVFNTKVNIQLGGNGSRFTVEEGGKAIITSGRSVRLLPGTMIEAGGQLVVKVTPTRRISGASKKASSTNPAQIVSNTSKESIEVVKACKIYPVPESASITGSNNGVSGVLPPPLRISIPDDLILSKKLSFPSIDDPALKGSESKTRYCTYSWGENPATIRVLRV